MSPFCPVKTPVTRRKKLRERSNALAGGGAKKSDPPPLKEILVMGKSCRKSPVSVLSQSVAGTHSPVPNLPFNNKK